MDVSHSCYAYDKNLLPLLSAPHWSAFYAVYRGSHPPQLPSTPPPPIAPEAEALRKIPSRCRQALSSGFLFRYLPSSFRLTALDTCPHTVADVTTFRVQKGQKTTTTKTTKKQELKQKSNRTLANFYPFFVLFIYLSVFFLSSFFTAALLIGLLTEGQSRKRREGRENRRVPRACDLLRQAVVSFPSSFAAQQQTTKKKWKIFQGKKPSKKYTHTSEGRLAGVIGWLVSCVEYRFIWVKSLRQKREHSQPHSPALAFSFCSFSSLLCLTIKRRRNASLLPSYPSAPSPPCVCSPCSPHTHTHTHTHT